MKLLCSQLFGLGIRDPSKLYGIVIKTGMLSQKYHVPVTVYESVHRVVYVTVFKLDVRYAKYKPLMSVSIRHYCYT